ncbi:LysR family transcriptional regulator [Sphingomonas sp. 67-36]|uniref:LysR family transcriptional regulator n=1 Tax=Sphingomonas sp. 67-36 TaxID=1895849 RepID=UPI0009291BEF|nr:LysR family transcriptional regulator [Sphingomonas sp. 67-36]OJV32232.1 MAG: hypothetical protein BGO24_15720 [Sphingomonas sp. 67-36]
MNHNPRLDLNLLGIFEAIYTRGGVTAAGRHLNLSQSALSHALGRLRRAFDDPLFVRSGNTLVPTALARSIIDPIRESLRGIEMAVTTATSFDPGTSTRAFRIGLRQSSEMHHFHRVVQKVAASAPGVTLASEDFRRGYLARALARGELDLALDLASEATMELEAIPLGTDAMVVAARRSHPRISGNIDLNAYLAEDHVIVSPRRNAVGLEDQALAGMGSTRQIAVRCQHSWSAWTIVAETDMLLTIPASHAASLSRVVKNQILPLPFRIEMRPLQLLWHAAARSDPGNAWLRGVMIEALS